MAIQKGKQKKVYISLIIVAVLLFISRYVNNHRYSLKSTNMYPTISLNEVIYVNRSVNCITCPTPLERGDIILHESMRESEKKRTLDIFRLIGIEGDRITLNKDSLYLNGKILTGSQVQQPKGKPVPDKFKDFKPIFFEEQLGKQKYIIARDFNKLSEHKFGEYIVPKGKVFVLGDNREFSHDSRWYFVPVEKIKGKHSTCKEAFKFGSGIICNLVGSGIQSL